MYYYKICNSKLVITKIRIYYNNKFYNFSEKNLNEGIWLDKKA